MSVIENPSGIMTLINLRLRLRYKVLYAAFLRISPHLITLHGAKYNVLCQQYLGQVVITGIHSSFLRIKQELDNR